jgi:hypothetical protein
MGEGRSRPKGTLRRFYDLPGTQATGADPDMNTVAARGGHSDALQVGKPAPPGLVVGMADVIAGHWTFAADFTFFCHDKTPYIEKVLNGLFENGLYTVS